MYAKKVSKDLNCQKWLFINVKINPIKAKTNIKKIKDNIKLRR